MATLNEYSSLVSKTERKRSMAKPSWIWKNCMKMYLIEMWLVVRIGFLTQSRNQWHAVVNKVTNFQFLQYLGKSLYSWATVTSQVALTAMELILAWVSCNALSRRYSINRQLFLVRTMSQTNCRPHTSVVNISLQWWPSVWLCHSPNLLLNYLMPKYNSLD